jgi:small subunit ribosomal protein S20
MRNAAVKSQVKTAIKKYEASLKEEDLTRATELLKEAGSTLDKAAQKGVIHKSQVNRRKSRLSRKLNAMSQKSESNEEGLA